MKKRILCFSLAIVMAAGLTACNFSVGRSGGAGGTNFQTLEYESAENQYHWAKPKTTLQFSVYGGQGDPVAFEKDKDGGKKYYDEWLLKNMNVKLDWHLYSDDTSERLNMMLAADNYPEVITSMPDDMANKFIAQGKAIDLTGLIQKYAPNYTRRIGQYFNMLKDKDSKVYKLDSYYGENPNVAGWDFGIRYDYWKQLGKSKLYETPQEYFDTMREIMKNHPKNKSDQQTYAFSSCDKGMNFLNAMLAAYGFIGNYKVQDGKFMYWLETPQGLEIAKLMNQAYRAGMVDPDYLNNNYDQMVAKMNNEQILGNLNTWWYAWTGGHEYWAVQEGDKYNSDKRFMNVSVHGDGVDLQNTYLLSQSFVSDSRCILTNKCKHPADVMKFINWQNDELGNIISGWGPPSEDNFWNITSDGTWKIRDDCLDPTHKAETFQKRSAQHGANIYTIATNGNWLHTTDSPTQGKANFDKIDPRVGHVSIFDFWTINSDGTFKDPGVRVSWGNYKAPMQDRTLYKVTYPATDDISVVNENIKSAVQTGWAGMMSAKDEAACEAVFNSTKQKCEQLGLEKLTRYNQEAYQKNAETFKTGKGEAVSKVGKAGN